MASNGIINPNKIQHEIETLKSQKQEIEARISLLQSQLLQQHSSSTNDSCSPISAVQGTQKEDKKGDPDARINLKLKMKDGDEIDAVQVRKTSKHKESSQRRLCEQPFPEIGEKRRTTEMEMSERQEEDKVKNLGDLAAYITLEVLGLGDSEAVFRIKRSNKLQKLMNAYCAFKSVDVWSIAFIYDGRRIYEDRTPDQLKMEDGDVIFAVKVPRFP